MREIKYPNGFTVRLSEFWFRDEEEQAIYREKCKMAALKAPRTSFKEFKDFIDKEVNG